MAKKFLSFNRDTGLLVTTGFEDGKNHVRYEQDLEPFWDANERSRNEEDQWGEGMKQGIVKAAFVPDLVIMDMLTRFGVNFYDKSQRQRVLQLIETEYPKCKLVNKRLA